MGFSRRWKNWTKNSLSKRRRERVSERRKGLNERRRKVEAGAGRKLKEMRGAKAELIKRMMLKTTMARMERMLIRTARTRTKRKMMMLKKTRRRKKVSARRKGLNERR